MWWIISGMFTFVILFVLWKQLFPEGIDVVGNWKTLRTESDLWCRESMVKAAFDCKALDEDMQRTILDPNRAQYETAVGKRHLTVVQQEELLRDYILMWNEIASGRYSSLEDPEIALFVKTGKAPDRLRA